MINKSTTKSIVHNSTAKSAGIIMLAFVLANIIGLIRQIVINRTFGTSPILDSYFAAFRVPDLLFNLVAGGALASAFIPTFTGLITENKTNEAWRLASAVLNWLLIISIGIATITSLYAPWITKTFLAPGFSPDQITTVVILMRLMLMSTVIFTISGLIMGIHHSHHHFLSPAIAPIFYNLGITAGAIFLTPQWGISGLAYGVIAGAILHCVIQLPQLLKYSLRYSFNLEIYNKSLRTIAKLMIPRTVGLSIWQINFWINTTICSGLPSGSLSALVIAFQVFTFPQAAIAQAIATAIFPKFSKQAALNHTHKMRQSLNSSLRGAFYLAIPASAGLYMLGKPIIELLFQNNTFSANSTSMVVWALNWYILGLIAHTAVEIITRAFYALKDTYTPMLIGGLSMIINVILSITLSQLFSQNNWYPHGGLALANTIATYIEMSILIWIIQSKLDGIGIVKLLKSMLKTTLGTVVMIIFLYLLLNISQWSIIITLVIGIIIGPMIFWSTTAICGSQQSRKIPTIVIQQLKNIKTET